MAAILFMGEWVKHTKDYVTSRTLQFCSGWALANPRQMSENSCILLSSEPNENNWVFTLPINWNSAWDSWKVMIPWRFIHTKGQRLTKVFACSSHPELYLPVQPTSSDTAEVTLGWLPFSHIYGLMTFLMRALYQKYTVVVMAKYTPRAFLQATATHRVSRTI